ncbi:MAG: nucleotidyltransferase domain-containing protein [Candidatus Nanoarchaeia archaeon]|nr:nucleotidyltransferase domain-containing protein [Candidatus Nanoarchaeia archaeon]
MTNELIQILAFLIDNKGNKFSIRRISIVRGINYKSAYNVISKLKKEGSVALEKLGNTTLCSFSGKLSPHVFTAEFMRREQLMKNPNFKVLYSKLNRINAPFIALLFGSFAKKEAGRHSDIDILVIAEETKAVEQAISLLPLNIHLTAVKTSEFLEMAKSREFTVVSEAIKRNILLVGIEDYYRLMENVV